MALKHLWLALAISAAFVASTIIVRYEREDLDVDACMDVIHGSFDYSTMTCDTKANHVFVSYGVRHPHDQQIFLTSICFCLVGACGYSMLLKRKRDHLNAD